MSLSLDATFHAAIFIGNLEQKNILSKEQTIHSSNVSTAGY